MERLEPIDFPDSSPRFPCQDPFPPHFAHISLRPLSLPTKIGSQRVDQLPPPENLVCVLGALGESSTPRPLRADNWDHGWSARSWEAGTSENPVPTLCDHENTVLCAKGSFRPHPPFYKSAVSPQRSGAPFPVATSAGQYLFVHSTVTLLARLRGLSTSQPRATAM